jgi:hypothetical protein
MAQMMVVGVMDRLITPPAPSVQQVGGPTPQGVGQA